MEREQIIARAKQMGMTTLGKPSRHNQLVIIERIVRDAVTAERERICKAIKEEDDYCVTEGDYMLDSDDCIAVARGAWVRPDFSVDATKTKGRA